MREQQEGYRSAVAETKVGEPEVSTAEEAAMPSVEDLDALLRESENVATVASMSEEEIDGMVERRQKSLDRLQNIDTIQESRLREVENFNPLEGLKPNDYKRLVQEEMIDAPYAERLEKLDKVIAKLESLDFPSTDARAQLEKLSGVRNAFRGKIESQIAQQQEETATRREEVKNKVLEHYAKRMEELEKVIAEIESNPRVIERLQTTAEKERQAFQIKIEQERKKIVQEAARCIQSLGARHANAFKRIGDFAGNEKIADELMQILGEGDERRKQSALDKVRSRLMNAVIDGEGEKQLKDPKEIVPWRVASTTVQYGDAIDFLRFHETEKALQAAAEVGNEQAEKLLEQRKQIIAGNEIIRRLVGSQWVTDPKTNEKRMGAFWAAFETRKKNDKEGVTAARKKEREKAAEHKAAFEKSMEEIIQRGGFVVKAPVMKEVRGNREIVGEQRGAVRLEQGTSKKGNEFWKVTEIFGVTNGLKVGNVSPLDMRSFPQWLRESAKPHFVMRGENFIERLAY